MELFDISQHYHRVVTSHVLASELLIRFVCAFTVKYLSQLESGESWALVTARYYGESPRMLIELFGSSEPQDDALTATMLLSSYEMTATEGQKHRKHYFGAIMLIRTHSISASFVGIHGANFWVHIRHEIVIALVNDSMLQINPSKRNVN